MVCEDCINRRSFLATSTLAAVFAVLSGCGDGDIGGFAPSSSNVPDGGPVVIKVSDFPGLATVGTVVKVADRRAALKTADGSFDAYSMICTHQQTTVDIISNQFICPSHGSRYASNGDVLDGPATKPLVKLAAQFDPIAHTLTISNP